MVGGKENKSEAVRIGTQVEVEVVYEQSEEKENERGTNDVGRDSLDTMANTGKKLIEKSTRVGVEAPKVPRQQPGHSVVCEGYLVKKRVP